MIYISKYLYNVLHRWLYIKLTSTARVYVYLETTYIQELTINFIILFL